MSTSTTSSKTNAPKMTNIFADSEEKLVKTVILYGKSGDNYLYVDEASATASTEANRIDKDALLNMCLKGVTVSYGNVYYTPLYFGESAGSVSVTFITGVSVSTSLTGTVVTLYSKEYSAD